MTKKRRVFLSPNKLWAHLVAMDAVSTEVRVGPGFYKGVLILQPAELLRSQRNNRYTLDVATVHVTCELHRLKAHSM